MKLNKNKNSAGQLEQISHKVRQAKITKKDNRKLKVCLDTIVLIWCLNNKNKDNRKDYSRNNSIKYSRQKTPRSQKLEILGRRI